MKKILTRFISGFLYSIGITLVIQFIVTIISKKVPMLPEFIARFDNSIIAFMVQLLLIGLMSGITSCGTVVFEAKRIGFILQSFLFLLIMLLVWIPVSCFVWSFHKNTTSMITTVCSIVVTYAICWVVGYVNCKNDIVAINARLGKKRKHEECN